MKWLIHYWSILLSWVTAGLFMTLMLITAVDVIGRYIFDYPLPGSTELTEFVLGLLIFSSLPIICKNNQHISVDLLEERLSPRFKKWSTLIMQGILFLGTGFLTYGMYLLTERAKRDELVSEILLLPVSFFYLVTTLLLLMSMLAIVIFSFSKLFRNAE